MIGPRPEREPRYHGMKHCQWCNGDPKVDADMCQAPRVVGRPYCQEHCEVAYTAAPPVSDKPWLLYSRTKSNNARLIEEDAA